jgi:hypothetical protein
MRRTFRAVALPAAVLLIGLAGANAGPSIASEGAPTPAGSYDDHAGTPLTVANLGLNDVTDPVPGADDSDLSAPVEAHSDAPILPESGFAEEPAEGPRRSLADLVADYSGTETSDAETDCLARAVYWESKGEPYSGQLAVAEVIINRAESGRFASTICGVVRQRGQFSFVHGGHIPAAPSGSRDWRVAVAIAQIATRDLADGAAPRALFFHARRVNPGWHLTRIATVGNHVFYR